MLLLYNILLALCLPFVLPAALLRTKYRRRTLERLGLRTGRSKACHFSMDSDPVIWIHALSVGEVTSALPLVKGIRASIHPIRIVFTASTRSGKELAEKLIAPHVDCVLFSPLDVPCAVRRYLTAIRPDLFILVETDFWPNWLRLLRRRNVSCLLVNGRISAQSFTNYSRFSFFFRPMFRCFNLLSMQTAQDRDKMLTFGIPAEQLAVLGNLKYDFPAQRTERPDFAAEHGRPVWVCGSTHPGEEEIIFAAFKSIVTKADIRLILAPRQISRGSELLRLAQRFGLTAQLRSSGIKNAANRVLILDTLGELAGCYSVARLAFIGGSLVHEGGHNPIEAAAQGVPVLFGQHMEDFAEIARDLTDCGGAKVVTAESLAEHVASIFSNAALHQVMSCAALELIERQRGGVARHVQAIGELLRISL